ncbi:MAG: ABC transporter permease [Chloroflexota bacterium]|nr:MAG: ABC transporter permease [Chloroflexota bacterium]
MPRYILYRLPLTILVLFGVSILTFAIVRLAPGDPSALLVDPTQLTREEQVAVRRELGLEDPLPVQYVRTVTALAAGELRSFRTRRPTVEMVLEAAPSTLLLVGSAVTIGVTIGVAMGAVAALRPYSRLDDAVSVLALFGLSVPSFWLGLMLIYVFAENLHWLPASGLRPSGSDTWNPLVVGPHLLMPTLVLASGMVAAVARYTRSSMLEALRSDYVRTARAKGLRESQVVVRHALRNSLITVVTLVGVLVPILLSGSVVVESVFGIPGMGRLAVSAALARDYPVVMTTTMVAAALVVLSSLVTDLGYTLVDPRIRLG